MDNVFKDLLLGNEIHVWRGNILSLPDISSDLTNILSEDEIKRALKLNQNFRRQYLFSRISLRILIGRYTGSQPEKLKFSSGKHGKPLIDESLGLSFNVSHSDEWGFFVFAKGPIDIGIDIEKVGSSRTAASIERKYISAIEKKHIRQLTSSEKTVALFQLWTFKEAWVKATGEGISETRFDQISFIESETGPAMMPPREDGGAKWNFLKLSMPRGYVGSISYKCRDCLPVKVFEITGDLFSDCVTG